MKTLSVTELKAHLSEELRHVQAGAELVVTDRGQPVARIVRYAPTAEDPTVDRLAAAGLVRVGPGVSEAFWAHPRRPDPDATLRQAALADREEGW